MKGIAVYWLNTLPFAIFASYFTGVMLLSCWFDLLIYLRTKTPLCCFKMTWRRRSVTPDCCATRVAIPLPNVNERLCPVIAITKCSFILYLMKRPRKTVFWLVVLTVAVASQNLFFRLCQGLSEHSWNDLVRQGFKRSLFVEHWTSTRCLYFQNISILYSQKKHKISM